MTGRCGVAGEAAAGPEHRAAGDTAAYPLAVPGGGQDTKRTVPHVFLPRVPLPPRRRAARLAAVLQPCSLSPPPPPPPPSPGL